MRVLYGRQGNPIWTKLVHCVVILQFGTYREATFGRLRCVPRVHARDGDECKVYGLVNEDARLSHRSLNIAGIVAIAVNAIFYVHLDLTLIII